jgi:hypothetical protein
MGWSQARLRKWHKDNPGENRFAKTVARVFRKNRHRMIQNLTKANALYRALMRRTHGS